MGPCKDCGKWGRIGGCKCGLFFQDPIPAGPGGWQIIEWEIYDGN